MRAPVVIGGATLYCGDCRELLGGGMRADAIITDPPYSERCHAGHDSGAAKAKDGAERNGLGYAALSVEEVGRLAGQFAAACDGWIAWMTDSDLALAVRSALESAGRYAFAPLPFYQAGRSVRLSGDGPNSWTDWIVVARTKAQNKWGTLPGGYIAGPGWNDKARMGGKPTELMKALVRDYSRPGDVVLDPFMGAGTTGVAALLMGRKFIGCEVDADAFEVARARIEAAHNQASLFSFDAPAPQAQEALL